MFNEVGQMLPGQMSLWQLSIVKVEPGKLFLKFGQNCMSNSWDVANIEFPVGGGGGVRLICGWVGVLTTISWAE